MKKPLPAHGGFTLLELMVSMAVLSVVAGAAFSLLNTYQKNYQGVAERTDLQSSLRNAIALISQEVGQAGAINTLAATGSGNVVLTSNAATAGAATVLSLQNSSGTACCASEFFVNEKVVIDTGANQELVQLAAVDLVNNTITPVSAGFAYNHPSGVSVFASGIFNEGVMPGTTQTYGTQGTSLTQCTPGSKYYCTNTLDLIGDLNGDGTIVIVRYQCTNGTTLSPGKLTRSTTPITASSANSQQDLVTGLILPVGSYCFTILQDVFASVPFLYNVQLQLTVQTATPDPQTGTYYTVTKSLLNIRPRNIAAGIAQANKGLIGRLQNIPGSYGSGTPPATAGWWSTPPASAW